MTHVVRYTSLYEFQVLHQQIELNNVQRFKHPLATDQLKQKRKKKIIDRDEHPPNKRYKRPYLVSICGVHVCVCVWTLNSIKRQDMILITIVNFIPGLIMYLEIPRESRRFWRSCGHHLIIHITYSSSSILPSMLTEKKKTAVGSSASIKELRQKKKFSLYLLLKTLSSRELRK